LSCGKNFVSFHTNVLVAKNMASGSGQYKLHFFEERSGYAVTYNECLRETRNAKLAKILAKERWESLPQPVKDAKNAAAKAKWAATHPPPPPESAEEKRRLIFIFLFVFVLYERVLKKRKILKSFKLMFKL